MKFTVESVRDTPKAVSPALVAILLVSMAVAAIAPFDVAFLAATFGSPALRVALMAVLVLIGAFASRQIGFKLTLHGAEAPGLIGLAAAAGVAIYVVAVDCMIFREILPVSYVHFFQTTPLGQRFVYFTLRAFNENVIYRLFLFSTVVYLMSLATGRKAPGAMIWVAMFATQALNIGMNVIALAPEPLSPIILLYDGLRYVVPGMIWAWLYWRLGFLTAEIASVGCHVFLQPAIGVLL